MVLFAKLSARRRGIALPAALFALTVTTILAAGVFAMTDSRYRSVNNRQGSTRAVLLAEEGAAFALGVMRDTLPQLLYSRFLRGNDAAANTTDDGLLVGYGLSSQLEIPAAGKVTPRGTYTVRVIDDPGDPDGLPFTDSNDRVLVRCVARTPDGASATVDVILFSTRLPAFAVDGNMEVNGVPAVLGQCGGIHSNGDIAQGGTLTIEGSMSAAGTITTGTILDIDGSSKAALPGYGKVDIPDMDPMSFCTNPEWVLRADGFILHRTDNSLHDATKFAKFGWKRFKAAPVIWQGSGSGMQSGTVCAEGNVEISGNMGSDGNPMPFAIYATGSVELSGTPFIRPPAGDSVLIAAGGDVRIGGNPGVLTSNYEGLIYADNQCLIDGNPGVNGQVLCKNLPQTVGSVNYVDVSGINGNPTITYNCTGSVNTRRRMVYWAQRLQ